ncbi:MAG: bifunctional 4-hydroxy-2-oxoglutarate aldolase/2-dehydro-3-deoxy-phosphogluconate aldolase [Candidatus Cryptobacteroides sp.]
MARFTKLQTLSAIKETGIVPVFYNADAIIAKNVAKACYEGGIRAFEFTNRGDFAHEVFAEVIKTLKSECPEMIIGAGTVLDAPTAALFIQLGANFIVSPNFNPEVAKLCNRRGIPYSPGCGSVTEIGEAQEAGCDLVKVFPAGSVGGPGFVKSILAPLPWTMIMATGAVEPAEDNLRAWAASGVTAVGMGSKLFPKEAIASGNWKSISELCRKSLEYFKNGKK